MREKRNFAERSRALASKEVFKKYFLVYEGKNTEAIYFDGIIDNRDEIGLNPLIELVPVIRSYSEEGWSNPKKIYDRMAQNLREAEEGIISYETLLNWFMDYFYDEEIIKNNRTAAAVMWDALLNICDEQLHIALSDQVPDVDEACTKIVRCLEKEAEWSNIVNDIPKFIENKAITFDRSLDRIVFIIDRDKDSFVSDPGNDQYQYVLDKCRENGYGFCISNPCFEFWLLMHFDEVADLDKDQLKENPKVSARRRYTEQELRRLLPRYSKAKYSVQVLMKRIEKAILNEKMFCEDEDGLKDHIGSRVGILIEELKG